MTYSNRKHNQISMTPAVENKLEKEYSDDLNERNENKPKPNIPFRKYGSKERNSKEDSMPLHAETNQSSSYIRGNMEILYPNAEDKLNCSYQNQRPFQDDSLNYNRPYQKVSPQKTPMIYAPKKAKFNRGRSPSPKGIKSSQIEQNQRKNPSPDRALENVYERKRNKLSGERISETISNQPDRDSENNSQGRYNDRFQGSGRMGGSNGRIPARSPNGLQRRNVNIPTPNNFNDRSGDNNINNISKYQRRNSKIGQNVSTLEVDNLNILDNSTGGGFINKMDRNRKYIKSKGVNMGDNNRSFIGESNLNNDFNNDMNSMSRIYQENDLSNINNSMNNSYYKSEPITFNIEDLLIYEEKYSEILSDANTEKTMTNECFEFWNYFFTSSIATQIDFSYKDEEAKLIIKNSLNHELFSVILAYDLSFFPTLLKKVETILKEMLKLNHLNLIVICEHIYSKISEESMNNVWVYKLRDLITNSGSNTLNDDVQSDAMFLNPMEKIKHNITTISSDIRIILKNYESTARGDGNLEKLVQLYKKISFKSYDEINDFFRSTILRVSNPNASVLASVLLSNNQSFIPEDPPYLKTKNLKPYTLVLDLDETIVYFKVNQEDENEGVLKVRPGIYDFLESLGKFYEIIIFTAATQEYADLLIDNIEENRIYFDYRLYRQHTVIVGNDFVKDLRRIGRPLDKIIIVDNMPQNFRLQKENGIIIRPFWGDDIFDTALFELMNILINIAMEGGDVRKGLKKYRDEIVRKVTTNISRHQK
ncbi:MAG: HAD family hydrolase [archaeon]|nr:HAD family hydrolase [archaeon]